MEGVEINSKKDTVEMEVAMEGGGGSYNDAAMGV